MDRLSISYESVHGRQNEPSIAVSSEKIDLSMRGITKIDLSPLEVCKSLGTMDLSKNKLMHIDLAPLSDATSLRSLRLRSNRLHSVDLWPLRNLRQLNEIDLSQNQLPSINLSPVIHQACVSVDESTIVELDYTLRYLLGGKDSTRIKLCNSAGKELEHSPRMFWIKYDEIISKRGWSFLRETILYYIQQVDERDWFRLQKGLLEGFGIDELAGFDGDPRFLLEGVPSEGDYHSIRNAVYDRVIECIERQLKDNGSSLFLNVEKMSGTRASKLVPLVVARRKAEMQDVVVHLGGNRVNLLPLWLTHYGSEILLALRFGITTNAEGLDLLSRNLKQLDYELKRRQVDLASTDYPKNISTGLIDFIYSIASMN